MMIPLGDGPLFPIKRVAGFQQIMPPEMLSADTASYAGGSLFWSSLLDTRRSPPTRRTTLICAANRVQHRTVDSAHKAGTRAMVASLIDYVPCRHEGLGRSQHPAATPSLRKMYPTS
jgi:hypothetical protein